jgi:RHS repeat-associated protein
VFKVVGVVSVGSGGAAPTAYAYFYTIGGQKVATIQCTSTCSISSANVYFGGKLIRSNGVTVATDRLGSVRANVNGERMSYYPYGQERTSTADGREKFGTYFRDGPGQDYADQRYYNQAGAFWSPDPGGLKTANPMNPGSWNRYAYALGDPINRFDPWGMASHSVGEGGDLNLPPEDPCWGQPGPSCNSSLDPTNPDGPDPSSNTSGSGTINISNLSTTSFAAISVQNQLRWIKQELLDGDDPSCNDWLKDNQSGIAWMLGDSPGSTMKVGVGNFSDSSTNAVSGTGGTNLTPGSMIITVNVNGGFFNTGSGQYGTSIPSGTFEGQIFILLHELAHGLVGSGGGFRDNDNNPTDQTYNNQQVLENCGATIRRAAGGYN